MIGFFTEIKKKYVFILKKIKKENIEKNRQEFKHFIPTLSACHQNTENLLQVGVHMRMQND